MDSQRGLIYLAALIAAAVVAWAPAGAQASSLLSGYGGPGQGSQALLGSTLIGGGGGSSSGSGSGGSAGSASSLEASSSAGRGTANGGGSRHSRGHHAVAPAATGERLGRTALAGFHETAAGSSTLGLSGIDLVYILAVLAGLVLIAVLMRGAVGGARPGAPD